VKVNVFFRNTMMHGYWGHAVYLDHQIISWEIGDGFLVINPYWFWGGFKQVYANLFAEVQKHRAIIVNESIVLTI
jgi:hypothetical protein